MAVRLSKCPSSFVLFTLLIYNFPAFECDKKFDEFMFPFLSIESQKIACQICF